jgi:hypothetical protein
MTINFKRYINSTILISIPALFQDGKRRPLKFIGVQHPGLHPGAIRGRQMRRLFRGAASEQPPCRTHRN